LTSLKWIAIAAVAALSLPGIAAAADYPPIEVSDAWARINKTSGDVSVYFDIVNHRDEPNSLVAVFSPVAEHVTLSRAKFHNSRIKVEDLAEIRIGAMSRRTLRPGDYYVTLAGLKTQLSPGMRVPLTLRFESGAEIEVEARINNQLLGNRGRQ
jgi:copper(I)-binding protein